MLKGVGSFVTVGVLAIVMTLSVGVAAHADFGGPVDCVQDPTNPSCVITVGGSGGDDGGSGGSTSTCKNTSGHTVPCYVRNVGWWGGDGCWYKKATGSELEAAETLGGTVKPPAYWYVGSCGDPATNWYPITKYLVFTADPGLLLLAQEAIKHLNLPAPRIHVNPDASAPQVVYVPTWLWIDPATYTNRSATASITGLSVTATATPTKVTWSTGDGGTVVCGAGTPWRPGMNPAAASPDCGHTYTTRSPQAGPFTLTATITWRVSWVGGGASGTEPAMTSTSSVQLRVLESSVLNTK